MDPKLWKKELWTQKEVAEYFRVVQGTVKNWRDQGLLSYWQAPGSTRVLYYRDEIKALREQHTTPRKGGGKAQKTKGLKKGMPVVSAKPDEDWRI